MKRKEFIKSVAVATICVPVLPFFSSCSNDEGDPTATTPPSSSTPPNTAADCSTNGTNVSVGSNHGHSLTVSASDVQSATDKTYSIAGSSGHDHTVTVTASQFDTLKTDGGSISATSSTSSGHSHSITVSCA